VTEVAMIRFRGGQWKTADEWRQIYLVVANSANSKK
jgi:hypothetical protein